MNYWLALIAALIFPPLFGVYVLAALWAWLTYRAAVRRVRAALHADGLRKIQALIIECNTPPTTRN